MSDKIYVPKYFRAHELVPPKVLNSKSTIEIFDMFDQNLLRDMDTIRELCVKEYGEGTYIIVNDWQSGGKFTQRGLRTDLFVGAKNSPHRTGDAFDFDVWTRSGETNIIISSDKIRTLIRKNKKKLLAIRRIERKTNWVHVDTIIHEFNP